MKRIGLLLVTLPAAHFVVNGQTPDATLFESKIRPVLAKSCYGCHSSKMKAPMGGLVLDTKAGLAQGGVSGPVVVPGKPAQSKLLTALRYTDPHLQMPPSGKLAAPVLEGFEQWIAAGAVDPRVDAPATAATTPLKGMSVELGRKWWSFQPLSELRAPPVKLTAWPRRKIDHFLLAKLEEKKLAPSPQAEARTLVQRAYIDLLGYRPTFEEVEEFANDQSPDAYARLIDKLLASQHYGEAWGRRWLDVARFAEDNPTSEATNPPYPYAWRYRDWVIEALNRDEPYDRFVKLQLAADLMPGVKREDYRALGYLGAAPVYHKDQRLSHDVIYTFLNDDWDERVDAVSRGLLGLTVACARCHDHKFDPIPTKDYYGLMGVFASTMRSERPLFEVDPAIEARYQYLQNRLFDLSYSRNLLTGEASTVEGSPARVARWKEEIAALRKEAEALQERYPKLVENLEKYWREPVRRNNPPAAAATPPSADAPKPVAPVKPPVDFVAARRRPTASNEPFINAVYEAAQYVDGSDANYTFINYKPGETRDLPVMRSGNVAAPGEIAPRHFLTVLAKGDPALGPGSGRLALAEKIFGDGGPLAARVMVNRVWAWHFGKPLVATPSDFGTQGDKPTHPELLDDLAARFVRNGWSLKWLHREIMLSAAFQQSSARRADGDKVDQINSLLWRMNPQRLSVEAYRDSILRIAGTLDTKLYGVSLDLDLDTNNRRTVYGRVSRSRVNGLLKMYDFPDATQTSPGRDLTITPLQQLFVMNGTFLRGQALTLAKAVKGDDQTAQLRDLYRKILSREPTAKEIDLALSYLASGSLAEYAHVLLSTNEVLFQK
jgi:hypothetical protein